MLTTYTDQHCTHTWDFFYSIFSKVQFFLQNSQHSSAPLITKWREITKQKISFHTNKTAKPIVTVRDLEPVGLSPLCIELHFLTVDRIEGEKSFLKVVAPGDLKYKGWKTIIVERILPEDKTMHQKSDTKSDLRLQRQKNHNRKDIVRINVALKALLSSIPCYSPTNNSLYVNELNILRR